MPILENFLLFFIFFCIAAVLVWALRDNRRLQKELKQTELERVKLATALENYEKNSGFLQTEFKNIAQEIFDKKNESLIQNNKQQVNGLLAPLNEKIQNFQRMFTNAYDSENKDRASLKEQIRQLTELNQQVTQDTKNLTQALKGDAKTQGYWGEVILERILEQSGLIKDSEYSTQKQFQNDEGQSVKPDVIIHLPQDRKIIIDSKVSLTAYETFASATEIEQKEQAFKSHLQSVKRHIQDLSNKNYHSIPELKSLDFTLMFIPIEPAFYLILQQQDSLYQEALRKKIMLVGPFTLMAMLKSLYSIWQLEKQNKNAEKIAKEVGKVYDKFVTFADEFSKIKKKLTESIDSYDRADKLLSKGRSNIIEKIEDIRELGIQNKKQLPNKSIASDPEKKIEELENS